MVVNWLRENKSAAVILTLMRLYLGYTWMIAGFSKLTGPGFDASGYLKNAIANPVKGPEGNVLYGWYVSFLESFVLPNVELFNVIVPVGEFLVGLGLIVGGLTTAAAFFALVMNYAFFLAGTVSTNPATIFLGAIILFAGYNAGRYGLDNWIVPLLRKRVFRQNKPVAANQT